MSVKKIFKNQFFLIVCLFVFTLFLRLYGLDWDQGQHLHPDERFLTMLVSAIQFPSSLGQYFDTVHSPLNPYNYQDFHFFVYGTFPVFLVKAFGHFLNLSDYTRIHLVGRVLSAVFDAFNILSLFFLSKIIFRKNFKFVFLPSLFYAMAVLPIQLSHFFAVDTFLNFFILSTFVFLSYWLDQKKKSFLVWASITFGLALSCKVSALLFFPVIFLFFLYKIRQNKKNLIFDFFVFLAIVFVFFRIFQPYAFVGFLKINSDFIDSLKTLKLILLEDNVFYPPEIQWLNRLPVVFPFLNIFFWGLGIPFFLSFIFGFKQIFNSFFYLKEIFKNLKFFLIFVSVFWIFFLLIEQGFQFTSTMRYFLPIYPFLCFLAAFLVSSKSFNKKIFILIIVSHLIYCFAFLSIYSRPHSRVQSSIWIYQNVLSDSKITNEYWDDPLPLYLPSFTLNYQNEILSLYDPDTSKKWRRINPILEDTDYIFMTSNRLWGSIPRIPDKYPVTTKFYQNLFDEKLSFKKVLETNSYPGFIIPSLKKCFYFGPTNFPFLDKKNKWFEVDDNCEFPGLYLRDDTAEEAFTVYDHPKVLIFKNTKH